MQGKIYLKTLQDLFVKMWGLKHMHLGFCQITTHKIESIILKLLDPLIENCSN